MERGVIVVNRPTHETRVNLVEGEEETKWAAINNKLVR